MLVRIERPARDPHDASDPVIGLQQRHQAEAERARRASDRHREIRLEHHAHPSLRMPQVGSQPLVIRGAPLGENLGNRRE